ncbi:diaminopimelate epimerase [Anaeromyxobacter paludicola]|uniref:Diaminopimelate epimerase n=1 Tax=Anaeromyxobacter paludicola TaxID=2918171 RepID=A0ABM7XB62_9BACT|nr:diaminopimelate epimerase [Anaeromyxobacter paludicola]BDG09086.1 diaminopimelate epimerase [Anaeromyxobacter paludicola]
MALSFQKYQGLGNDFVVIEAKSLMDPDRARRLCDRRRGIGADGVLTLLPPKAPGAVAFMHVYNSDGSVAAMCGNGVRCVARHLADARGLDGEIDVETAAGLRRCTIHRGRRGAVESISVAMGPARDEGEQAFAVGSELLRARRISMGNPHAVIFGDASVERATAIGPTIEAGVPGGVNVGFAATGLDGLDLVVWERGAGLTEACGTGACAAAAAAVKLGLVDPVREVEVRLPGGPLRITVARDLSSVLMRGPAERVFTGETEL